MHRRRSPRNHNFSSSPVGPERGANLGKTSWLLLIDQHQLMVNRSAWWLSARSMSNRLWLVVYRQQLMPNRPSYG